MWGMETIQERFASLLNDYEPSIVILAGDIVDGGLANREAIRGLDGFFFHHGHGQPETPDGMIEVTGHWHPSVSMSDGAGLQLRLPSLVQERRANGRERWVLPAFSPWAGGGPWRPGQDTDCLQGACGEGRVFKLP